MAASNEKIEKAKKKMYEDLEEEKQISKSEIRDTIKKIEN